MKTQRMTIFNAYNETKRKLKSAGIEDYGFEARVIIRQITGFDNKKIMLNYNASLDGVQEKELENIINSRMTRYPLQYILGEWEFYGLRFKVGEGVLIPRSDTEVCVETGLRLIENIKNPCVLDLCAGSGVIGITVAANRADGEVYLLEKYEKSAAYLKENIALNNTANTQFIKGDALAGDCGDKKFDLIISNPPYIKSGDIKNLQPEVRYEPISALDGGNDGLDFYRAIIKNYKSAINENGSICFEVGAGQAEDVCNLLKLNGFSSVSAKSDLNGIDRVVFGTVK